MRGFGVLMVCLFGVMLAACSGGSPLPDMEPGEQARVVRVIDGDALVLQTGQSVRLIGLEAPALRPRGRDPEVYAEQSARLLEDMVLGREVQLYYAGLTRDRYDRALAHVVTTDASGPDLWVNHEVLRRGGARVRLYPDTARRGDELFAAEAEARGSQTGIWGEAAYQVWDASRVPEGHRGFTLVAVTLGARRAPLESEVDRTTCRRDVIGADLIIRVRRSAEMFCNASEGERLELRGWVSNGLLDLEMTAHVKALD